MVWIPHYFLHRAEVWHQHSVTGAAGTSPSAVAYTKCQAAGWANMAMSSIHIFKAVNPWVVDVWGGE